MVLVRPPAERKKCEALPGVQSYTGSTSAKLIRNALGELRMDGQR